MLDAINGRGACIPRVVLRALLSLLRLVALPTGASAHLMPPGHGTLRVEGDTVFSLVSVPVSALRGFDDDGDRLLSVAELDRHRADIVRELARKLALHDGLRPGQTVFEDLLISHSDDGTTKPTEHLVVMRRTQWPSPVTALGVHVELFDDAAPSEQRLNLTALQGQLSERIELSAQRTEHRFFEPPKVPLASSIDPGAEHIRFQHLALLGLFLLAVLIVVALAPRWRSRAPRASSAS